MRVFPTFFRKEKLFSGRWVYLRPVGSPETFFFGLMYFLRHFRYMTYQFKERYKAQILYHVNKDRVTFIAMCIQCRLDMLLYLLFIVGPQNCSITFDHKTTDPVMLKCSNLWLSLYLYFGKVFVNFPAFFSLRSFIP